MKLEEQVCSLDLAKQLKGLGVKQESVYFWIKISNLSSEYILVQGDGCTDWNESFLTSAFTVAELGALLPDKFYSEEYGEQVHLVFSRSSVSDHIVYYVWAEEGGEAYIVRGDTEANTRAKMLVYLIENELL